MKCEKVFAKASAADKNILIFLKRSGKNGLLVRFIIVRKKNFCDFCSGIDRALKECYHGIDRYCAKEGRPMQWGAEKTFAFGEEK